MTEIKDLCKFNCRSGIIMKIKWAILPTKVGKYFNDVYKIFGIFFYYYNKSVLHKSSSQNLSTLTFNINLLNCKRGKKNRAFLDYNYILLICLHAHIFNQSRVAVYLRLCFRMVLWSWNTQILISSLLSHQKLKRQISG